MFESLNDTDLVSGSDFYDLFLYEAAEFSFEAWMPVCSFDIASGAAANFRKIMPGVFPSLSGKLVIPLIITAVLGIVKTPCFLLH